MATDDSIQEQIEQMLVAASRPGFSDYELAGFLETIEGWVRSGKISRVEAERLIARLQLLKQRLAFTPEQVEDLTTDNLRAIDANTLSVDLAELLVSMSAWIEAGVLTPDKLRMALAKVLASDVTMIEPEPEDSNAYRPRL